jgi:hypothetical protein
MDAKAGKAAWFITGTDTEIGKTLIVPVHRDFSGLPGWPGAPAVSL